MTTLPQIEIVILQRQPSSGIGAISDSRAQAVTWRRVQINLDRNQSLTALLTKSPDADPAKEIGVDQIDPGLSQLTVGEGFLPAITEIAPQKLVRIVFRPVKTGFTKAITRSRVKAQLNRCALLSHMNQQLMISEQGIKKAQVAGLLL